MKKDGDAEADDAVERARLQARLAELREVNLVLCLLLYLTCRLDIWRNSCTRLFCLSLETVAPAR